MHGSQLAFVGISEHYNCWCPGDIRSQAITMCIVGQVSTQNTFVRPERLRVSLQNHQTTQSPISGMTLQWRHNERDSVSNQHPHDCLLIRLFRRRSTEASKLLVTGFVWGIYQWPGNSPHKWSVTRKKISIWWRHHGIKHVTFNHEMLLWFQSLLCKYTCPNNTLLWWSSKNVIYSRKLISHLNTDTRCFL